MSAHAEAAVPPQPAAIPTGRARPPLHWRAAARAFVLPTLALLTVAGVIASIRYGPVPLSLSDVARALSGGGTDTASTIVWELRVPRVLIALLVGLNLSVAGVLMQALSRNPLADPRLTGVTAGAALAATIVLVGGILPAWGLPFAAFTGALVTAIVVQSLAWQPGAGISPLRMILAGVAVASMLDALTTLLMIHFNDRVQPVLLWLSGNLIGVGWKHLPLILPYSILGLVGAGLITRQLDILQLGDDSAANLGVRVGRLRLYALALSAPCGGIRGLRRGYDRLRRPDRPAYRPDDRRARARPALAGGSTRWSRAVDLG